MVCLSVRYQFRKLVENRDSSPEDYSRHCPCAIVVIALVPLWSLCHCVLLLARACFPKGPLHEPAAAMWSGVEEAERRELARISGQSPYSHDVTDVLQASVTPVPRLYAHSKNTAFSVFCAPGVVQILKNDFCVILLHLAPPPDSCKNNFFFNTSAKDSCYTVNFETPRIT